jgi:hypothetical protein
MSRQAYRLERQVDAIETGAEKRLGNARAALVISQTAAKLAEFGHLVVEGWRRNYYTPAAALVRTIYEEATLLGWINLDGDPERERDRAIRVALQIYRDARNRGYTLPPDGKRLLETTEGPAAKKAPSLADRTRQLDAMERRAPEGREFWVSHLGHVAMLADVVHPGFLGPTFTDQMTRELLGFNAIAHGHQYLVLGSVAAANLSDQRRLARRAQDAYARIHPTQRDELERLIK